jgi:hypothetical protein
VGKMAELYVDNILKLHGAPKSIVSDRGTQFTARFWKSLHESIGTTLEYSSAYHSQTDVQTERVNKVLGDLLRVCVLRLGTLERQLGFPTRSPPELDKECRKQRRRGKKKESRCRRSSAAPAPERRHRRFCSARHSPDELPAPTPRCTEHPPTSSPPVSSHRCTFPLAPPFCSGKHGPAWLNPS